MCSAVLTVYGSERERPRVEGRGWLEERRAEERRGELKREIERVRRGKEMSAQRERTEQLSSFLV